MSATPRLPKEPALDRGPRRQRRRSASRHRRRRSATDVSASAPQRSARAEAGAADVRRRPPGPWRRRPRSPRTRQGASTRQARASRGRCSRSRRPRRPAGPRRALPAPRSRSKSPIPASPRDPTANGANTSTTRHLTNRPRYSPPFQPELSTCWSGVAQGWSLPGCSHGHRGHRHLDELPALRQRARPRGDQARRGSSATARGGWAVLLTSPTSLTSCSRSGRA